MTPRARQPAQRQAADPLGSAWVSANAGSGKTAVLVDRIVRLLLIGAEPARLLCLTYTRAAAAEMADRLNGTLGAWATCEEPALRAALQALLGRPPGGDEVKRARSLFALTLETPGGLKIQTIHAFCEAVLGRFPLEADVPQPFSVIDERTAGELTRAIRERLLERAAAAPDSALARAVARVAELGGGQGIEMAFEALKGVRRKWRTAPVENEPAEARAERLREWLGLAPDETEQTVTAEIQARAQAIPLSRIVRAMLQGGVQAAKRGQALADALASGDGDALVKAWSDLYWTGTGEPRKDLFDKAARAADAGAERALADAITAFEALSGKRDAAFVADATAELYVLAEPFFAEYEREKTAQGLLDYDDLIGKAEALLTAKDMTPWVLYKLDGGIDHVLIDEAQDTSPEQWNIVKAIAEEFFAGLGRDPPRGSHRPRTVFAVGDLKQSIYSFQGADPESFERVRAGLAAQAEGAGIPLLTVPLRTSFRTAAPVLELVDAVFAQPDARDGVAQSDDAIRHEVARKGEAGRVELWPLVTPSETKAAGDAWAAPYDAPDGSHPAERLGARVAERIAHWLKNGERLVSQDRPLEPGDILVLVRRRNALTDAIIRELKRRDVPVAGADRLILLDHMAAQDLAALGDVALNPLDDLNLGGVLKGPLGGLSEEDLFDLAHGRTGALWDALRDRAAEEPFARVHARLSRLVDRAAFAPPFEFFARELGEQGGRERLLRRLGPDAADPIDEFLNLALAYEAKHGPSLQGFLHWLRSGETSIKRDLDMGSGQVRVMTVHGAKGLEANVVILPDTAQTPSKSRRETLLDAGEGRLVWSLRASRDCPARRDLLQARRALEMREYRRLLYVALTRARDRLVVCGYKDQGKASHEGNWYALIRSAMEGLGARRLKDSDGETLVLESQQTAPLPGHRVRQEEGQLALALPPWLDRTDARTPEPRTRPSRGGGAQDAVAARFGQIVHALLLKVGQRPDIAAQTVVEGWARTLGASPDDARDMAAEALRVRCDPGCAGLFGPHARGEAPFDVWRADRGERMTGRFDRLVIEPGVVRVVEFKTARRPPLDSGGLSADQARQIALYAEAAGILFPGSSIEAEIVWTAGPRRMRIPASVLLGASAAP
jgi:ATP-dependent helicase/nuclease subunit A